MKPSCFISWSLIFGTLLVSNRNPDDLTSKFGIYVGEVLGNGFDKVDLFVDAGENWLRMMKREKHYQLKLLIMLKNHNVDDFIKIHIQSSKMN